MVAGEADEQPIGRVRGAEAGAFPGEAPVRAVGEHRRIGFGGQKRVAAQGHVQRIAQKGFRALNRLLAPKAAAGGRLFQRVVIAHDAARRVHAYVELFFLQRLEEARVPIPDVHLGSHQAIGFCEAGLALEVGFLVVIHAEDDGGLVVFDGEALSGDERAGLLERGLARHLEIDGRFREGLEEVTVGDAGAQQSGEQPEQEHPGVSGVQANGAGPLRG